MFTATDDFCYLIIHKFHLLIHEAFKLEKLRMKNTRVAGKVDVFSKMARNRLAQ
jgi:hypothetical protein